MYRLASIGLTTPPCGVPRVFSLPPLMRRFPSPSRSSTGPQPQLDQPQHIPIDDAPSHPPHQFAVRNGVEVLRQIGVHYICVALQHATMHFLDRVARSASAGSHRRCPPDPPRRSAPAPAWRRSAPPGPGSSEFRAALAAAGLRDHHPPHRFWLIRLLDELLPDSRQPLLQPSCLDLLEAHPIHSRRALVGSQIARHGPECPLGRSCRRAGRSGTPARPSPCDTASSEAPDTFWCCQTHRQSPILASSQAHQK